MAYSLFKIVCLMLDYLAENIGAQSNPFRYECSLLYNMDGQSPAMIKVLEVEFIPYPVYDIDIDMSVEIPS